MNKNKTKAIQYVFNVIVSALLYLASVVILAILLTLIMGHMFLIHACTF